MLSYDQVKHEVGETNNIVLSAEAIADVLKSIVGLVSNHVV